MKRYGWLIATILLVCNGCQQAESETYSEQELSTDSVIYGPPSPSYEINAIYSEQSHEISAQMKVTFENTIEEDMQEAYFNIWPNADEIEGGSIAIKDIFSHEKNVDFTVNKTVLEVSGLDLAQGQSVTLEMNFTVTIPESQNRFGWSGQQVSLGNWFPILAVHDNHGWNLHPYFPYGEAFYSLSGNFDVTFEVPTSINMIATGESTVTEQNETTSYHFKAENVRDFAAVLHSDLLSKRVTTDETEVVVHYTSEEEQQAEVMLEAAEKALFIFTDWFDSYPSKTLDIVSVDYSKEFDGGMEYPELVMVNTPHMQDDEELALTVVHEIAHQWFYSLIGNDPYREPWLDESLTTFVSYAAFYETTDFDWIEEQDTDYSITSSVEDFDQQDIKQYGDIMYDGGALMLSALHDELGNEAFFQGLRNYVNDYTHKIATTADFIRIMEETSDRNLKPFFTAHEVYVEETK